MRTTARDPSLPHQVVIEASSSNNYITVTCNCRKQAGMGPIGRSSDRFTTQDMYNDPSNHVPAWLSVSGIKFGPEHEIHYADVEVRNGQRSQSLQQ